MESTTASTDQHRPITPKPFRKLSPWNLFIHLVFKGTDEERREWSALIQVSDPISGATDKEISTAYKKVKEDKALMEKLDKKLAIINNPVAPTCEEKRKEIIEKWMKDIVSRVDMMTKLFDFDITLLISPQREEDWQAEVARSTTKSSDYSIRKMGGIDEFVKGCKEFSKDSILRDPDIEENVNSMEEEGGDEDRNQASSVGYVRPSQKRRASVSNYFKKEMLEAAGQKTDWTRFSWKKFKRTIVGCKGDGSDIVSYVNKTDGVEIVGFDFGVDNAIAVNPQKLSNDMFQKLETAVNDSIDVANEHKKVRIIKIADHVQDESASPVTNNNNDG